MEPVTIKIFYLKKKIIFPYCTMTVLVRPSDVTADLKKGDRILALTIRTVAGLLLNRNRLATLAEVMDIQTADKTVKILLKGLTRVRVRKIIRFKYARFEHLEPQAVEPHESINDALRKKSQELIFLINVEESDKLINLMNYIFDLNQMTDFIANYFIMDFRARYRLYKETDIKKRSNLLISELSNLISTLTAKGKKVPHEKNNHQK